MKISIRTLSIAVTFTALLPLGVVAQRGGFGGPMQQQRRILAQFDKNGDKRLDAAERKTAREWLATQASGGFGGRRGGPFGNAAPPEPGRKLTPADVKSYPTAPVYDPMTIRTAFLQFEASDWEQELAAFNNTDVDVPGRRDHRRQDLQGRRRSLPRRCRRTSWFPKAENNRSTCRSTLPTASRSSTDTRRSTC